jgi:transcriptional regulator with XRE-family HTH domain
MEIINRIFNLINERGISQKLLSDETGIKQSVISDWKKGKYSPSTDAVSKIAQYFKVTTDYLLGLSDTPTPYTAPLVPSPLSSVSKHKPLPPSVLEGGIKKTSLSFKGELPPIDLDVIRERDLFLLFRTLGEEAQREIMGYVEYKAANVQNSFPFQKPGKGLPFQKSADNKTRQYSRIAKSESDREAEIVADTEGLLDKIEAALPYAVTSDKDLKPKKSKK